MNERGGAIYGLLAAIGFVVVLMAVIFAVCMGNAGAQHSLGRTQLVGYERGGDDCWDYGDCDDGGDYSGYHGDYGGGGNGNRGRRGDNQRGDKNCHSICGNTIIVPSPGGGDRQPPKDDQPQSLVPPTPDKVIKGFQAMVDGGIALGTNMAKLVTDYVVTIFRFIV